MQELTIASEFSIKSYWWLPDGPDEKVPGVLRHRPGDSLRLETIGGFSRLQARAGNDEGIGTLTLHGETAGGVPLTLFDCFLTSSQESYREGRYYPESQELHVEHLAHGFEHVLSCSDLSLQYVTLWMDQLNAWVWEPSFERSTEEDGRTIVTRQTQPETREWNVEPLECSVRLQGVITSWGGSPSAARSRLDYALSIQPDRPRSYNWFYKILKNVRDLLSLLLGDPVYFTRVEGCPVGDQGPLRRPLVFSQRPFAKRPEIRPRQQIAPFREVEERMESVFNRWFSRIENLSVIRALFFDRLLAMDVYDLPSLFGLIQVVEGCHRLASNQVLIDKAEFRPIKEALFKVIPDDLPQPVRDRLKSSIGFATELSLRDRLRDVISSLDSSLRSELFPETGEFIGEVVRVRNYLAHLLPEEEKPFADTRRLVLLTDRLRVLATVLLLREAGLTERECLGGILRRFGGIARA